MSTITTMMTLAMAKLVKKIARLAHGIARRTSSHSLTLSGKTQKSRLVLLHVSALIFLKALNFNLPSQTIDSLFAQLDFISCVRLEDYCDLEINVLLLLSRHNIILTI